MCAFLVFLIANQKPKLFEPNLFPKRKQVNVNINMLLYTAGINELIVRG